MSPKEPLHNDRFVKKNMHGSRLEFCTLELTDRPETRRRNDKS